MLRKSSLLFCLLLIFIGPLTAAAQDGLSIMNKERYHNRANTSQYIYQLAIVHQNGELAHRKFKRFSKKYKNDYKYSIFFVEPEDYKNMSLLMFDPNKDGKLSDSWIYLPESQRVKRIINSNKGLSFAESDITYSDLEGLDYENWDHKVIGSNKPCGDKTCWIIQSKPKKDMKKLLLKKTKYRSYKSWVDKDSFLLMKREIKLRKKGRKKIFEVKSFEKQDGYWFYTRAEIKVYYKNKVRSTTVVDVSNMKFDQDLPNSIFTQNKMKRGVR